VRLARTIDAALVAWLIAPVLHAQETPPPARAQPPPPADIVPPTLVSNPAVAYPEGASGDAVVVLLVTVNDDGSVRSAKATESLEPFARIASQAALLWRFEPAKHGGKSISARVRVEVAFHAPMPPPSEASAPSRENPDGPSSNARAPRRDIEEVTVRGQRGEPSRTATLSRAEVRQIPGVFGDPFRAIEALPGVTPIVTGLPFFFIRGAPPGNVGYFLDGIPVPYLFHVGAGPSVVHPALIERVDLYPGGYPALFGRYSGGIVSGETILPRPAPHSEYNVRIFDVGALVEAPVAEQRGTVLLGGRYSYTALLLTLLNSNTALDYWDYQARVTYNLTPRDQVSAFTFGSHDFLGQKTPTGTNTLFGADFYRLDLRYDHRIGAEGTMRSAVTGGIDRTQLDGGRVLRDRLVRARDEIAYRVSPRALVRTGTDAQVDSYDIALPAADLGPAQASVASLFPSRTDIAIGAHADVVFEAGSRLEITPGARVDFFGSEGATAVAIDPRLAAKTVLTHDTRLLSALGIAHQTPSFVIPVPGFQPGGLRGGLQRALQESFGAEVDLGPGMTATATVFHNAFFNLSDALSVMTPSISGCRPGQFPSDTISGDPGGQPSGTGRCGQRFAPGTIGSDRAGGGGQGAQSSGDVQQAQAFETRATGSAYGFELYFKRKLTSRLGGFLSYTLSRSSRTANGMDFVASFDRTHVLNTAVAYDLGRNWRAGTRVTFYTGLPKAHDPTDPGSTRLAPFFRVDLRLEKRWQTSPSWWISFVAEWLNATLSKESIGTSCTLQGCQETKIGPVTLPSLGVEGGF
jgi:TonB family protein